MNIEGVFKKLSENKEKPIGINSWYKITQAKIDAFAKVTLDEQFIHVDAEKAKTQSLYQQTVAHGYFILSLNSYFLRSLDTPIFKNPSPEIIINYGLNKVRFINPVLVDSKIRASHILKDLKYKSDKNILITLETTFEIYGQIKPACVAECLSLLVYK